MRGTSSTASQTYSERAKESIQSLLTGTLRTDVVLTVFLYIYFHPAIKPHFFFNSKFPRKNKSEEKNTKRRIKQEKYFRIEFEKKI